MIIGIDMNMNESISIRISIRTSINIRVSIAGLRR